MDIIYFLYKELYDIWVKGRPWTLGDNKYGKIYTETRTYAWTGPYLNYNSDAITIQNNCKYNVKNKWKFIRVLPGNKYCNSIVSLGFPLNDARNIYDIALSGPFFASDSWFRSAFPLGLQWYVSMAFLESLTQLIYRIYKICSALTSIMYVFSYNQRTYMFKESFALTSNILLRHLSIEKKYI